MSGQAGTVIISSWRVRIHGVGEARRYRGVAAETLEEYHGVLGVARLENVLLEGSRCLGVEDSFLLE